MTGHDSLNPAPNDVAALVERLESAEREADRQRLRAERRERLNAALEAHSREVENSLVSRQRFFAAMNHELRTPITAILGYYELLEKGIFGPLSDRHADVMRKISASAHQLLAISNDMLDLSKMEAGMITIDRSTANIRELVSESTDAVEAQASGKGITVRVDCPPGLPDVRTDPVRARQVLLNLLANAIKFTHEGGVVIHARHLDSRSVHGPEPQAPPGKDGWLRIAVEDSGVGIEPEKIESIFEEFVQTETGRQAGGTGLGLAISRRLARLLGGDLTAESTPGARSIFALYLPCPDCPENTDGPQLASRRHDVSVQPDI